MAVLIGCQKNPQFPRWHPRGEYTLGHWETTGITSYVAYAGKEHPIVFSSASSSRAIELLYALEAEIFLPNSREQRISVVGRLATAPHWFPETQTVGGRQPERALSFILEHWYLRTPFLEELLQRPDQLGKPRKRQTRETLEARDFSIVTTTAERKALIRA